MESLRDIRQNIKAIKSTQQIMQTMKMISSARIRKAQEAMENARPFATKILEMIADLKQEVLALPVAQDEEESLASRFLINKTADQNKIGLVVITGDKGLTGSFNAVVLRAVVAFLKKHQNKEVFVFCIGKKGRDFISRFRRKNIQIVYNSVGIFPKVTYAHAELLGEAILKEYLEHKLSAVTFIYNDFKSIGMQRLVELNMLPFNALPSAQEKEDDTEFLFEPGVKEIFKILIPRLMKANMYRILLESQAANLAATMNAMDAASKNAGELVDSLGVKLNKVRQAGITNEILDIVNGAEALNS